MRGLFKHSVRVAVRSDMVGMVVHALDGTKVRSKVATRGRLGREALEKLLTQLDQTLSEWEEEIEQTAAPEEAGTGIPEHLQGEARLREKVRAALAELDAEELEQVHPEDPEARVMKCSDIHAKRLAYNSQAVVDADCGIIVAQDVSNEATDHHQLTPMLNRVEEELSECADTTLADAGYATADGFAEAEVAGRTVLVNLPSRMKGDPNNPYHASHFDYDPESDTVTCPLGETLVYKHTRKHRSKGQELRLYRCMNKDCPVRAQCTKDRKGRGIELGPNHAALARQKRRQREEDAQALLKRRRGLIERVFGTIKDGYGFRRFTRHGLENAQTEWALMCTTYNMKKLYNRWKDHRMNPSPNRNPIPA